MNSRFAHIIWLVPPMLISVLYTIDERVGIHATSPIVWINTEAALSGLFWIRETDIRKQKNGSIMSSVYTVAVWT